MAVAVGGLLIGLGIGFLIGKRSGRNLAEKDMKNNKKEEQVEESDSDDSDDETVAAAAAEPKLNRFEELKMTFVCPVVSLSDLSVLFSVCHAFFFFFFFFLCHFARL